MLILVIVPGEATVGAVGAAIVAADIAAGGLKAAISLEIVITIVIFHRRAFPGSRIVIVRVWIWVRYVIINIVLIFDDGRGGHAGAVVVGEMICVTGVARGGRPGRHRGGGSRGSLGMMWVGFSFLFSF